MGWVEPLRQLSPPFGAVMVRDGGTGITRTTLLADLVTPFTTYFAQIVIR